MEKTVCLLCRQKFSVPTSNGAFTVDCPHCRKLNPNPTLKRRSSAGDHGRLSHPLVGNFMLEKLRKILHGRSPKPIANPGTTSSSSSTSARYSSKHFAPDNSGARKRALLCGISYKKWKYKLKGTINDVLNMKDLLTECYGFREENIVLLTEEQLNVRCIPTKANIEYWLSWLVKDCRSGDSLVFYYSGHGLRQPDFNNDERDGFDETICPVDFLKEGMILDNDIYATIVKPLTEGVTLHAIVDACHSGTILDLENVYDIKKKLWIDNSPPSGVRKQTSGGKAYCISACEDDQVAADTTAFSSKTMNGAMTYILIQVVRENLCNITYGELLDEMHRRIEEANRRGCLGNSRILSKIFGPNLTQKPLLSASERFDIYGKQFKL